MLTAGPPARKPPERPPPPPPRGGRARTVMASDAAQRPLGPRVLSATTTTAQQATRPHPAAAGAGLSPGLSLAPAPIAYGTGVLGSTVSAAHAIAQHQLVADAAQAAATGGGPLQKGIGTTEHLHPLDRLGRKIGGASFGGIYIGTNIETGKEIATKLPMQKPATLSKSVGNKWSKSKVHSVIRICNTS